MLTPVEAILSRVPGEVRDDSRIYDTVYTLFVLGRERKRKFTKLIWDNEILGLGVGLCRRLPVVFEVIQRCKCERQSSGW